MPKRLVTGLSDVRRVWISDNFTGSGTYADPIDAPTGGGGSPGNVDGGQPDSVYGGSIVIEGGTP
jgi:hypothetical protein